MPSLIASEVSPDRFYLKASNGKEWEATKTQLSLLFNTKLGTTAEKKAAVIADIKNEIIQTLGEEMISLADLNIDIDEKDLLNVKPWQMVTGKDI